ncbi:MAG TPA: hypothetical protein PLG99_11650, partial [Kaistiaceae bacterium]|nr:hypothetical protein [Kaistiaceae bacterium]
MMLEPWATFLLGTILAVVGVEVVERLLARPRSPLALLAARQRTMLTFFFWAVLVTGAPIRSAGLAVAVILVMHVATRIKQAMISEPLVFSDFRLALQTFRYPAITIGVLPWPQR